jgi:hypothetical protein
MVIKRRRMKQSGHSLGTGELEMRRILWLDNLGERHKWEDNIKTDLTDFGFKHMKLVQMGHETLQW